MKKETQAHLQIILDRLEKASQEVINTRGYTDENSRIRLLQELIKEQTQNEDTDTSTRPVR